MKKIKIITMFIDKKKMEFDDSKIQEILNEKNILSITPQFGYYRNSQKRGKKQIKLLKNIRTDFTYNFLLKFHLIYAII